MCVCERRTRVCHVRVYFSSECASLTDTKRETHHHPPHTEAGTRKRPVLHKRDNYSNIPNFDSALFLSNNQHSLCVFMVPLGTALLLRSSGTVLQFFLAPPPTLRFLRQRVVHCAALRGFEFRGYLPSRRASKRRGRQINAAAARALHPCTPRGTRPRAAAPPAPLASKDTQVFANTCAHTGARVHACVLERTHARTFYTTITHARTCIAAITHARMHAARNTRSTPKSRCTASTVVCVS